MIRAFLWGTDPKKLHLASGLPVKVRHIPANLFCQVDDIASDQGSFQCYFVVECTQNFTGSREFFGELHWGCHAKKNPLWDFSFLW